MDARGAQDGRQTFPASRTMSRVGRGPRTPPVPFPAPLRRDPSPPCDRGLAGPPPAHPGPIPDWRAGPAPHPPPRRLSRTVIQAPPSPFPGPSHASSVTRSADAWMTVSHSTPPIPSGAGCVDPALRVGGAGTVRGCRREGLVASSRVPRRVGPLLQAPGRDLSYRPPVPVRRNGRPRRIDPSVGSPWRRVGRRVRVMGASSHDPVPRGLCQGARAPGFRVPVRVVRGGVRRHPVVESFPGRGGAGKRANRRAPSTSAPRVATPVEDLPPGGVRTIPSTGAAGRDPGSVLSIVQGFWGVRKPLK